jgi:serine/threonine protein kinase
LKASFLTCPRCLKSPLKASARFCPRCGLAHVLQAAANDGPQDIPVGASVYRLLERVAAGSIANVYRCRFFEGPNEIEGVVKIVRDARTNSLLNNEAAMLRRLHAADPSNRYTPFLPWPQATFSVNDGPAARTRQALVLRMHPEIRSPDVLYTLEEVREHFPHGLEAVHVAWIWRRLLSILSYSHSQGIVHGAVLPPHVLIEPTTQKLVLIDWSGAISVGSGQRLRVISGGHLNWYKRENISSMLPAPRLDIALAARNMIYLLGGDPVAAIMPPSIDPALQRHFSGCISRGASPSPQLEAWRLLGELDQVIEGLWGARQFLRLSLPPK